MFASKRLGKVSSSDLHSVWFQKAPHPGTDLLTLSSLAGAHQGTTFPAFLHIEPGSTLHVFSQKTHTSKDWRNDICITKRSDISHFQMKEHTPPGISIAKSDNLEEWQMDIKVLDNNPLYKDQTYRLKFAFSNKYPIGKSRPSRHL